MSFDTVFSELLTDPISNVVGTYIISGKKVSLEEWIKFKKEHHISRNNMKEFKDSVVSVLKQNMTVWSDFPVPTQQFHVSTLRPSDDEVLAMLKRTGLKTITCPKIPGKGSSQLPVIIPIDSKTVEFQSIEVTVPSESDYHHPRNQISFKVVNHSRFPFIAIRTLIGTIKVLLAGSEAENELKLQPYVSAFNHYKNFVELNYFGTLGLEGIEKRLIKTKKINDFAQSKAWFPFSTSILKKGELNSVINAVRETDNSQDELNKQLSIFTVPYRGSDFWKIISPWSDNNIKSLHERNSYGKLSWISENKYSTAMDYVWYSHQCNYRLDQERFSFNRLKYKEGLVGDHFRKELYSKMTDNYSQSMDYYAMVPLTQADIITVTMSSSAGLFFLDKHANVFDSEIASIDRVIGKLREALKTKQGLIDFISKYYWLSTAAVHPKPEVYPKDKATRVILGQQIFSHFPILALQTLMKKNKIHIFSFSKMRQDCDLRDRRSTLYSYAVTLGWSDIVDAKNEPVRKRMESLRQRAHTFLIEKAKLYGQPEFTDDIVKKMEMSIQIEWFVNLYFSQVRSTCSLDSFNPFHGGIQDLLDDCFTQDLSGQGLTLDGLHGDLHRLYVYADNIYLIYNLDGDLVWVSLDASSMEGSHDLNTLIYECGRLLKKVTGLFDAGSLTLCSPGVLDPQQFADDFVKEKVETLFSTMSFPVVKDMGYEARYSIDKALQVYLTAITPMISINNPSVIGGSCFKFPGLGTGSGITFHANHARCAYSISPIFDDETLADSKLMMVKLSDDDKVNLRENPVKESAIPSQIANLTEQMGIKLKNTSTITKLQTKYRELKEGEILNLDMLGWDLSCVRLFGRQYPIAVLRKETRDAMICFNKFSETSRMLKQLKKTSKKERKNEGGKKEEDQEDDDKVDDEDLKETIEIINALVHIALARSCFVLGGWTNEVETLVLKAINDEGFNTLMTYGDFKKMEEPFSKAMSIVEDSLLRAFNQNEDYAEAVRQSTTGSLKFTLNHREFPGLPSIIKLFLRTSDSEMILLNAQKDPGSVDALRLLKKLDVIPTKEQIRTISSGELFGPIDIEENKKLFGIPVPEPPKKLESLPIKQLEKTSQIKYEGPLHVEPKGQQLSDKQINRLYPPSSREPTPDELIKAELILQEWSKKVGDGDQNRAAIITSRNGFFKKHGELTGMSLKEALDVASVLPDNNSIFEGLYKAVGSYFSAIILKNMFGGNVNPRSLIPLIRGMIEKGTLDPNHIFLRS